MGEVGEWKECWFEFCNAMRHGLLQVPMSNRISTLLCMAVALLLPATLCVAATQQHSVHRNHHGRKKLRRLDEHSLVTIGYVAANSATHVEQILSKKGIPAIIEGSVAYGI